MKIQNVKDIFIKLFHIIYIKDHLYPYEMHELYYVYNFSKDQVRNLLLLPVNMIRLIASMHISFSSDLHKFYTLFKVIASCRRPDLR